MSSTSMHVPSGAPTSRSDDDGAAVDANLGAGGQPLGARAQREVRDRGDAGQRLAAKAERADRRQVVGAGDLAGGVALDRQPRVLSLHPLAIVLDADRLLAAELDGDGDAAGAGVERVLDQLLDDRGRPLDDLARGDLVRQDVGGSLLILPIETDFQIHPFRRKNHTIVTPTVTMMPTIHQNCAASPPGKCGSPRSCRTRR